MELIWFVKEVFQNIAERAASYRFGQTILRQLDRGLWTIEKSARWAVPPPLDQDERPQPELIRPLPWVFFLSLLIMLRVARESLSLINLALGKPPVRSADVVTYIQSKRRYLRTLKYQGSRAMRARSGPRNTSYYSSLRSLLDFTMCFRRHQYGNNNTLNNDEVLIVKGEQQGEQETSVTSSETTMERLIEKMMVDVDADSDDSHSYTLTNVTSVRSDKSDYTDSEHEIAFTKDTNQTSKFQTTENETSNFSKPNNMATSTPEKINHSQVYSSNEFSTIKSELNSISVKEATANFIQNLIIANGKANIIPTEESKLDVEARY